MVSKFLALIHIGTQNLSDPADEKYIVLTNALTVLFSLFAWIYIPLLAFGLPDTAIVIYILIAWSLLLLLPLAFNYFGLHAWANLNIAVVTVIGLIIIGMLLGNQNNVHLYMLVGMVVPFAIYSPKEKILMYFHLVALAIGFTLHELRLIGNNPIQIDAGILEICRYFNVLGSTVMIFAISYYNYFILRKSETELDIERSKSENLLLNILPQPIAEKLKESPAIIADNYTETTILFADICGFTKRSECMHPEKLVSMLDDIFSEFDKLADRYSLEKIKTIGDAYMVVGGIPEQRSDHCEAVVDMALDMMEVKSQKFEEKYDNLDLRIGIHCGHAIAGVIGRKKFAYDLWGDSVNTAARMESHGVPGKIQVTETVKDMVMDKYRFEKRGEIDVKGKGLMETYFMLGKN